MSKSLLQNKCTQYWPEKMRAIPYGDIVINNVEEKEYAFYVIRKLTVSLKQVGALCNIYTMEYILFTMFCTE